MRTPSVGPDTAKIRANRQAGIRFLFANDFKGTSLNNDAGRPAPVLVILDDEREQIEAVGCGRTGFRLIIEIAPDGATAPWS
jgi:hypothetical protein